MTCQVSFMLFKHIQVNYLYVGLSLFLIAGESALLDATGHHGPDHEQETQLGTFLTSSYVFLILCFLKLTDICFLFSFSDIRKRRCTFH